MNLNKILQSLFGNKSTRDMKLIQPIVEKIKAEYPMAKAKSEKSISLTAVFVLQDNDEAGYFISRVDLLPNND